MVTLVSFLGRVRRPHEAGYRKANYRFPDGNRETSFFGLELARSLKPCKVVILGTAGSQWDFLVDDLAQSGELEGPRLELSEAALEERVHQPLLDKVNPIFEKCFECKVAPRLIPHGKTSEEQEQILQSIAEAVPEGDVHFDVTHGFRHLGMVAFTSAFMLGHIRSVRVKRLWYGALDMTGPDLVTPVLQLDCLNQVQKWTEALIRYEASGDYGCFAELLERDGFPRDAASTLREAAFLERTHNVYQAAKELRTILPRLDQPLQGASELFRVTLRRKLAWARSGGLDDHQRHLAWDYLRRHDFPRAALYGYEAAVSHHCVFRKLNVADYRVREKAWRELKENYRHGCDIVPIQMVMPHLEKLEQIRNSLAHGLPSRWEFIRQLLQNPGKLERELSRLFRAALGQQGQNWPW